MILSLVLMWSIFAKSDNKEEDKSKQQQDRQQKSDYTKTNNKQVDKIKNMKKEEKPEKKLEEVIDIAWQELSLNVPRRLNPNPQGTKGLKKLVIFALFIISLLKIIFGSVYFDECPTNDWLPIYLVVGGVLQFAFLAVLLIRKLRHSVLLFLMGGIALTWNFISSVNIFVEWEPDYFEGGLRYCNAVFFHFTFFCAIADYLVLIMMTCYSCIHFAFTSHPKNVTASS